MQKAICHKHASHAFRTVKTTADLNRPFYVLSILLDTQTMTGSDMRLILQFDHSSADIAEHISESIKMHLFQSITETDFTLL